MATSLMVGPKGGVPAVEGYYTCDAPLELLIALIVKEESVPKRQELGRVLVGILKEDQSVLTWLRRQNELLLERTRWPSSRRSYGSGCITGTDDPAVEGCDAPLELLITLIVKEESFLKRQELGHVVGGFLKEKRSVLSSLRKENELLLKRTNPPSSRSLRSYRSDSEYTPDHDGYMYTDEAYGYTDNGYSTYDGYADHGYSTNDRDVEEDNELEFLIDATIDATERYRESVYIRNMWEAYIRSDAWEPPSPDDLEYDSSTWTEPRDMLETFERCELPQIKSRQTSRREGWRNFLLENPKLRYGLEYHAKWGPDLDKQVQEILNLRLVANEGYLWPVLHMKHEKLFRQKSKRDSHSTLGHSAANKWRPFSAWENIKHSCMWLWMRMAALIRFSGETWTRVCVRTAS